MYPFQPFSVTLLLALVFTPEALNCQFRGGDRVEEEEKEEGGSFQLSSTLRISPQISHRRIFSNHGSPGHDSPGLDNVGAAEGILQVAWETIEGTGFTG